MENLLAKLAETDWLDLATNWGGRFLIALAIFVVGRWLAKLLARLAVKLLGRAGIDKTLADFLGTLVSIAITLLAIIVALDSLGVQTTSLIAILGAAGLAVGLALQSSLSNFAASVMIMLFKPFKAGDFVDGGGASGIVERIGIFHTTMRTADNQEVIVPNSRLTGDIIVNYSSRETRRINIAVGISYDDDIRRARELIFGTINQDKRLHAEPAAIVHVTDFGASSIDIVVRVWTSNEDYWQARSDLMEAIKKTFDDNTISIPFPQRVTHVISD